MEQTIAARSQGQCELCTGKDNLRLVAVPPRDATDADAVVHLCSLCADQLDGSQPLDVHHWHCLNDSMWSPTPAVQVLAWQQLSRLASNESWAQDLLDMLYLDDALLAWAKAGSASNDEQPGEVHRDCNGVELLEGDSVTLIKDLNVKGSSLVAKRGTHVRNIHLDPDNAAHIEGRVDGQRIVILTQFVKKSG